MKKRKTAETERHSVVDVGLTAYEDAGLSGLCSDGRWEAAVEAMRNAEGGETSVSLPDLFTQLASALAAERGDMEWPDTAKRSSTQGGADLPD